MNMIADTEPTLETLSKDLDMIKAQGSLGIANTCKAFFDKYPEALGIEIKQGSPTWNDGEPCEHSLERAVLVLECGEPELTLGKLKEIECFDEWESYGNAIPSHIQRDWKELSTLLYNVDLMLILFGDNSKVQLFRDGVVTVTEYNCG